MFSLSVVIYTHITLIHRHPILQLQCYDRKLNYIWKKQISGWLCVLCLQIKKATPTDLALFCLLFDLLVTKLISLETDVYSLLLCSQLLFLFFYLRHISMFQVCVLSLFQISMHFFFLQPELFSNSSFLK